MEIRLANVNDCEAILHIFDEAKAYLKGQNINQWQNGYPNKESTMEDIHHQNCYVLCDGKEVIATATIIFDDDPNYHYIENGSWLATSPYGVIHRIACDPKYKGQGLTSMFFEYAKSAEEKGYKVMIAGAGKAAHLPGMCAALFPMPVIGVPMKTSDLGGVDSLYSIVQMPSGIPVATVAINGGKNAGILAAKILAASDPELLQKLKDYSEEMKNEVVSKAEKLDEIGYKEYVARMKK